MNPSEKQALSMVVCLPIPNASSSILAHVEKNYPFSVLHASSPKKKETAELSELFTVEVLQGSMEMEN